MTAVMRHRLLAAMRLPRRADAALYVVVLVVALIVPLGLDDYSLFLANLALAYVPVAIGLTVVLGWTGQFAFTSAALFGLGAYSGGLLGAKLDLPIEAALVVGIVVGVMVGGFLALLTVRLSGYYLSIVTIAFTYLLRYVYENTPDLTGGVAGFALPAPYVGALGGQTLGGEIDRYYVGLVLATISFAAAAWLRTTAQGRAWQALRQSPAVAAALGIDVARDRVAAQAVGAAFFAAAGTWFAYLTRHVYPHEFDLHELIFHFLIVVIGGMGFLRGAVIAAVGLVVVREFARGVPGASEVAFGLALLVGVLFFRAGLYGSLAARWPRLREPFV